MKSLEAFLKASESIILATNHKAFLDLKPEAYKRAHVRVVIDGKNALNKSALQKLGIIYKGIGR